MCKYIAYHVLPGHVSEKKKMAKSKKSISFGQKLDIITDIEKGETQASVCRRLNLSKMTVSTIWRSRETLKHNFELSEFSSNTKRF